MDFDDSGLPNNALLRAAFQHSYDDVMSMRDEALKDFKRQMNQLCRQERDELEKNLEEGKVDEAEYKKEKTRIDNQLKRGLTVGPAVVEREIISTFEKKRLAIALEILNNSDRPDAVELIAAGVLTECLRSPIDFENISKKFGPGVAGLLAEVQHIDAYPSQRRENLEKAGSDTKRLILANIIGSMESAADQLEKIAKIPNATLSLSEGQEEDMFADISLLWGNDKKLDQRVIGAFNKVASIASSSYRIEISPAGTAELVNGGGLTPPNNTPPGKKPPAPGKKTGLGDDVF